MGHEKFSPSFAAADWQKYFKKLWAQTALGTRVVSSQCPNTGLNMRRFILDRAKLRIVKVTKGVRSEGRPPLDWGPTIARGEAAAGGRRMAGGGGLSSCSWPWPRVGSGRGWHRTPVGRHRHQASSLSWHLAATQAAQDSSEIRVGIGCDCNWILSNLFLLSHLNSSLPSFIQQRRSFCKQSKLGSDIEHPPTS